MVGEEVIHGDSLSGVFSDLGSDCIEGKGDGSLSGVSHDSLSGVFSDLGSDCVEGGGDSSLSGVSHDSLSGVAVGATKVRSTLKRLEEVRCKLNIFQYSKEVCKVVKQINVAHSRIQKRLKRLSGFKPKK